MVTKTKRNIVRTVMRFLEFRVLHINDSPHRIALGAALGFFVAWIPLIGLHLFIVLGLGVLLRANKFLALTCVWVSNPFTFIGIYYPNFVVGRFFLKFFGFGEGGVESAQIKDAINQFEVASVFKGLFNPEFWMDLLGLL